MLANVSAATRTRVQLCGPLVAEIAGRRVDPNLRGGKSRTLFACLVISRERPLSRDDLIDIIWPTAVPADPDGTLATLLTRLRNAVGHERVQGRGQLALDLGDEAWIDWEIAHTSVARAEALLAAGDPRAALKCATEGLDIARRPLLPGLSTPWLEDRRRELVDATAALLETAARAALILRHEHLPLAERCARELIEREPYRESGYGLLMEVHESRGNVAEALRVFDALRRVLREELGLTPARALTAFAGRLLCAQDAPAPAPVVPTTRVTVISGAAASGKSRLAASRVAQARAAGHAVLHGRAQRDGVLALEPFVEALRAHLAHDETLAGELLPLLAPELGELAKLVPALRAATPMASGPLDLARACDAIAALLNAAARRRPVLLVLEDLQWADRDTLRALRHVTRTAQITVLITAREDECLGALLDDLERDHALERISLS